MARLSAALVLCNGLIISLTLLALVRSGSAGVVDYTGAVFDGSFNQWVNNASAFCTCHYGGPCNNYVCAGGGIGGTSQNCDPLACSTGQYSFSSTDGFQIKVNGTGEPYRAFGYAELCGQNHQNSLCLSNGSVFTMSFLLQNAASWTGYVKLLFFGDGNNLIGYWPSIGSGAGTGKNQLIIWPNGGASPDLPTVWQTSFPLLDSVWYDVTVTINNFSTNNNTMNISIVENGPNGRKSYSGPQFSNTALCNALSPPQFGAYTWTNTAGPEFSVFINNVCAGPAGTCQFQYAAPVTTTRPATPNAGNSAMFSAAVPAIAISALCVVWAALAMFHAVV